jgi:hypothetical protein
MMRWDDRTRPIGSPAAQTFGVNKADWVVLAIALPIPTILDRIAGEESAGGGVVVSVTQQHEAGVGVLLVAEACSVADW